MMSLKQELFIPSSDVDLKKICCCCVVVLRPQWNAMVMSGRRVNLITLFLGPRLLNFLSCSTQLSMRFFLLINVKMATFMSEKTNIFVLSELKKAAFFLIF